MSLLGSRWNIVSVATHDTGSIAAYRASKGGSHIEHDHTYSGFLSLCRMNLKSHWIRSPSCRNDIILPLRGARAGGFRDDHI